MRTIIYPIFFGIVWLHITWINGWSPAVKWVMDGSGRSCWMDLVGRVGYGCYYPFHHSLNPSINIFFHLDFFVPNHLTLCLFARKYQVNEIVQNYLNFIKSYILLFQLTRFTISFLPIESCSWDRHTFEVGFPPVVT